MVPQAKARVAHSEMRQAALRMTGLAVLEDIAHTSQGSNQRLLPLAVDLAAQPVDVNIDDVGIRLNAHAPDLIENHRASDDAARIAAEILQQDGLLGSQLQDFSRPGSLAAKQIQFKVEDPQPGCLSAGRRVALEQVAQPGQQLGQHKRLGQVIVPALLQAPHPVIDRPARGKDQNGATDAQLTQLEDQADAVLVGQPKVDDQYVELAVDRQPLGSLAVCCRFRPITRLFKRRSQEALYIDFVFDEQKPHEGIFVHFSRILPDKCRFETAEALKALWKRQDEHFVMNALAVCHALSLRSEERRVG